MILTEHRLEDIFPVADRAVVMESGKIIAADTPRKNRQPPVGAGSRYVFRHAGPGAGLLRSPGNRPCPLTVREGRNWLLEAFRKPPEVGVTAGSALPMGGKPTALSLKELWFRYERNSPDVLRGVSAEVPEGSLFAIVGGNGAGKSTTLKAICGICRPYRGKIRVFGKRVEAYKAAELFQNCLAMLPQDPKSLFVKKRFGRTWRKCARTGKKLPV